MLAALRAIIVCALLGAGFVGITRAAEHAQGFDEADNALRLRFERTRVRLLGHRRHRYEKHGGLASENVEVEVGDGGGRVWLEYELPPARVIDDLSLELWMQSNRPGAAIALRVILPGHRDPETGGVLSTYVPGDVYESKGKWQKLVCRTPEKTITQRLQVLRWKLNDPSIDPRGMYVDRVVLQADLPPGTAEFFVDDLRFGPIVDPRGDGPVQQVSATEEVESHVDFRLDHLYVDGRPFFPRFVKHHDEDPADLAALGVNTVLVRRYDDTPLLQSLREKGLWAMATPPRPSSEDGHVLGAGSARLLPFGPETDPILLWHGGTRVKPERRRDVETWVAQIRRADRLERPMLVDVTGDEREFSRAVRTLGVTRHVLHGTFPMRSHHDWLLARRREAWPGTFLWTWIQTEPSPVHVAGRAAANRLPVVVEPEQIRLQVYAALGAGCRAIGYWTRTPLTADDPGAVERRLAIRQLNLELQLLEPMLATAGRAGTVSFYVRDPDAEIERTNIDFQAAGRGRRQRNALIRLWENKQRLSKSSERAWEAAVLRTSAGTLILPVWYGDGAQCVPGPMAANDASIRIAGVSDTATAWEITPTAVRSLGRGTAGPGGRTFVIPKFDQTAAILVTTDRSAVDELRRRIQAVAEGSSRTTIDLASAKLERVEATNERLMRLGVAQPDAPQLLGRARVFVERADAAHRQRDFDAARQLATDAMQLLRILQRADWEDATQNLASPVSSPHTLCHHTLPDHWMMVAAIGRSPFSSEDNLVRSGDFEDLDTMSVEGWWHSQNDSPGIRASAELNPNAKEGRYALRLVVTPEHRSADAPPVPLPDRSPLVVRTPPVPVRAGQLVHVGGWFRYFPEGQTHLDGPVVYDDLLGSTAALRLARVRGKQVSGWQRFEFIREIHQSRDMTVAFAMNGFGELHLDDVRITPLDPRPPSRPPAMPTSPGGGYGNPLDLLNRLPSLPSLPGFRGDRGTPQP